MDRIIIQTTLFETREKVVKGSQRSCYTKKWSIMLVLSHQVLGCDNCSCGIVDATRVNRNVINTTCIQAMRVNRKMYNIANCMCV